MFFFCISNCNLGAELVGSLLACSLALFRYNFIYFLLLENLLSVCVYLDGFIMYPRFSKRDVEGLGVIGGEGGWGENDVEFGVWWVRDA